MRKSYTILAFASFFVLSLFPQSILAYESTFKDVGSEDLAYAAIEYFAEKGILEGYEGGVFAPNSEVNRAEAVKIMVLVTGVDPDANVYKNCFPDVQEEWFARFVCYGKKQGWLSGHPDGHFLPASSVNHAELTKMALTPFFDQTFEVAASDPWYKPYLEAAGQKNIIWSYESQNWPSNSASREKVAEQFFRAMLLKQEGWNVYSDYSRDLYFKEMDLNHLINQDYPCYYSDFKFFPTFPAYLKSEYGITNLQGMLYDFREVPHFDGYQFCVSNNGNLVFSGVTSDMNGEELTMSQHLIHFDSQGNLIKDQWVSCGEWRSLDRPSLLINGVDLDSIEPLHCFYAKDKDHVYYRSDNIIDPQGPTGPEEIEGADPNSFELLTFPYSRDDDQFFFYWKEVENIDLESFQLLESPGVNSEAPFTYYAKDTNHVYYYGKIIPQADPNTFERLFLEGLEFELFEEFRFTNYSRDKNHVFFGSQIVEGADPESFQLVNAYYSADDNNVYRYGEKVDDWDGASFEIIDDVFMRDVNHVYYEDYKNLEEDGSQFKTVEGADPETFELVGEIFEDAFFYKDVNYVYFFNFSRSDRVDAFVPFEGVDPVSFEILSNKYVRDERQLYEMDYISSNLMPVPSKDFDIKNLEVLNNYYVKDVYGIHQVEGMEEIPSGAFLFFKDGLIDADINTFQVLDGSLAKDQSMIYSYGYSHPEVDPATFKKVGGENPYFFYKDKKHFYTTWGLEVIPTSNLDIATAQMISDTVAKDTNGVQCAINIQEVSLTICTQK